MVGRGRPKGSFIYKDAEGNPISVFEWRKLNKVFKTSFRERIITIAIPLEYWKIFQKLRERYNFKKTQFAEKIVIKYLKEKMKEDE